MKAGAVAVIMSLLVSLGAVLIFAFTGASLVMAPWARGIDRNSGAGLFPSAVA
jgi:hypothetical protein